MSRSLSLKSVLTLAMISFLAAACEGTPKSDGDGPVMEFVRIPAGSFQMGSPDSEANRRDNEGPVHEVRITKPFYMGKYEVTQVQWQAVMGTTVNKQRQRAGSPWHLKGNDPECPMYYVSWEEAVEFCKRLGKNFRLPTESEWEYACRAGSQTRFHYGDDPNYSELDLYDWYSGNSENKTHPVGQKKPNAWGLYDMHGNVQEWCSDRYISQSMYKKNGSTASMMSASERERYRVCRSGSWLHEADWCRSANRGSRIEDVRVDFVGFRIVYTGRVFGDKEIAELDLPEKAVAVGASSDNQLESRPKAIAGVVREETGTAADDVTIQSLPFRDWSMRCYAQGAFEVMPPRESSTRIRGGHIVARNEKRNLAVGMEVKEDSNELDLRLKPGVIVAGEVVDRDGKGIGEARVVIKLQTPTWSEGILCWVKTDVGGRFEFRALPPGYEYVLSAGKLHYRIGQTTVYSGDVRDNRVDDVTILLPRGQFSVSGVVVDPDGKPVPNVWIYCTGKDQAGINSHTDADGRFKADGIFEGQVDISASVKGKDRGWLGGSVSVQAGATNVRIVLSGNAVPPPKGRACFPGETRVWLNGVLVPISDVVEGQSVGLPGSGEPMTQLVKVDRIEEHIGKFECRDILLESGNRISVVDSHCFMLYTGRWLAAQDLEPGLRLKTLDGSVGIKSVTVGQTPIVGKVYNLNVTNSDCYAVGDDGIIVRDY